MSRSSAIRLVKSLSKSEKRQFKLLSKKQSGNKDYLDLFNLIDRQDMVKEDFIESKFKKSHPQSSIDNAATYLVKVLTDSLIQSRVKEDSRAQLLYGLLKVNILNDRNLTTEGFKELKRLQQSAHKSEDHFIQLLIYRYELNYYSENNFPDISEGHLVKTQMKARNLLKDHLNLHEHYSLYELLKHRLTHVGQSLSERDKNQLNDLILSEMGVVNSRAQNSLASRKLHLLFQSHFFTDIGDYRSALKTYYDLNRFFEKNIHLLKNPPMDYFTGLDGILDSLRTMEHFEDMDFYIQKLSALDDEQYPEYFRFLIKKTTLIYRLSVLIGNKNYPASVNLINESAPALWKEYQTIDYDKQNELLFYIGLAWFHHKKYKKAQTFINDIILMGKINYSSALYKAARLLDIIINYELKDLDYLDYEIRSYKRAIQGKQKLLKTDRLIFKTIQLNPALNKLVKNEILWKKLLPLFQSIKKDKYEGQLLKYFDFAGWAEAQFIKS